MYIPAHFRIDKRQILLDFINEFLFGKIIFKSDTYSLASHIPMEPREEKEKIFLYRHIAAPTRRRIGSIKHPCRRWLFFTAGHACVSSSWFAHQNVSTRNYRAVHATGKLLEL